MSPITQVAKGTSRIVVVIIMIMGALIMLTNRLVRSKTSPADGSDLRNAGPRAAAGDASVQPRRGVRQPACRGRPGLASGERAGSLSVVVCAYTEQRWHDLVLCISSLLAQQDRVGEVLLVIDHNEALLSRCRAQWPQLQVVPNTGPKGLSGARNTGWPMCRGPLVAFVDDDASADRVWSRELTRAYGQDVLGVGGHIDPVWPEDAPPTWWPNSFNWVVGCSYTGMPQRRSRVRNAIGANMSVRKHVLESVDGFEISLGRVGKVPLGAEETAMYLKAGSLYPDMSVVYEPSARVQHRVTPERVTASYFVKRCFGEGRSKARMTRMRLAPRGEALGTERTYVVRTLPLAMLGGLCSTDPRRGLAVLLGFSCTAAGYLQEVVTHPRANAKAVAATET